MPTLSTLRTTIGAVTAAVILAGCSGGGGEIKSGGNTEPWPRDETSTAIESAQADATESATESATAKATEEASPGVVAEPGEAQQVGDYEVAVVSVEKDATQLIAEANQFNEKAKHRFVMLTYEASYRGPKKKGPAWLDLQWSFEGSDGKTYETSSQVTPAGLDSLMAEIKKGKSLQLEVLFDVPPAVIDGGSFVVTTYDANFNESVVKFPL